jgi:hypothetical protein
MFKEKVSKKKARVFIWEGKTNRDASRGFVIREEQEEGEVLQPQGAAPVQGSPQEAVPAKGEVQGPVQ